MTYWVIIILLLLLFLLLLLADVWFWILLVTVKLLDRSGDFATLANNAMLTG